MYGGIEQVKLILIDVPDAHDRDQNGRCLRWAEHELTAISSFANSLVMSKHVTDRQSA